MIRSFMSSHVMSCHVIASTLVITFKECCIINLQSSIADLSYKIQHLLQYFNSFQGLIPNLEFDLGKPLFSTSFSLLQVQVTGSGAINLELGRVDKDK